MNMKILLAIVLSATCGFCIAVADPPVTNLVEILRHLDAFSRALELDMPHPISVANVTRWVPYRGPYPPLLQGTASILVGTHGFSWDVEHGVVWAWGERKYVSGFLYEHPEQIPACLLAVDQGASVMTTNQAVSMAQRIRGHLAAIGYSTNTCGALKISRPQWPVNDKNRDLPIYIIEWQWTSTTDDVAYMSIEIDGLRKKPSRFFTLQGSPSEQSMKP